MQRRWSIRHHHKGPAETPERRTGRPQRWRAGGTGDATPAGQAAQRLCRYRPSTHQNQHERDCRPRGHRPAWGGGGGAGGGRHPAGGSTDAEGTAAPDRRGRGIYNGCPEPGLYKSHQRSGPAPEIRKEGAHQAHPSPVQTSVPAARSGPHQSVHRQSPAVPGGG